MTPQLTEALIGAVIALLTALGGYLARPKVESALRHRRQRKRAEARVEAAADAAITPPEVK